MSEGKVEVYSKDLKQEKYYEAKGKAAVTEMIKVGEEAVWVCYANNIIEILSISNVEKKSEIKNNSSVYFMAIVTVNDKPFVLCSFVSGKLVLYNLDSSVKWSSSSAFNPNNFVTSIYQNGNHLWFGTSKGKKKYIYLFFFLLNFFLLLGDIMIMSATPPFEKLGSFDGTHNGLVSSIIGVQGKKIWSASHDKRIFVWSAVGDNISKVHQIDVHSSKINALVQTNDYVWSCSSDKSIFVWKKSDYSLVKEICNAHNDSILSATSLDNLVYSGSASLCKSLYAWEITENQNKNENK